MVVLGQPGPKLLNALTLAVPVLRLPKLVLASALTKAVPVQETKLNMSYAVLHLVNSPEILAARATKPWLGTDPSFAVRYLRKKRQLSLLRLVA